MVWDVDIVDKNIYLSIVSVDNISTFAAEITNESYPLSL